MLFLKQTCDKELRMRNPPGRGSGLHRERIRETRQKGSEIRGGSIHTGRGIHEGRIHGALVLSRWHSQANYTKGQSILESPWKLPVPFAVKRNRSNPHTCPLLPAGPWAPAEVSAVLLLSGLWFSWARLCSNSHT